MVKPILEVPPPFTPPTRARKARALSASQWVDAGLWAMREGSAAVNVDAVARQLGVTKGSFYWHFADRRAWLEAVLARWEALATDQVIESLDQLATPRQRLERLFQIALLDADEQLAIEVAIASSSEPEVQRVAKRVSMRRLAYVQHQYRALGHTRAQARVAGLLAYSAYVGVLQTLRVSPAALPNKAAKRAYVEHVVSRLLPAADTGRT
jgi:AcrR family transcriptional regulator